MRLRPGDWVIVALICAGHAADIPLVRKGHDTVSTCGRRWLPFWLAFTWHVFHPKRFDRLDLWWLTANGWGVLRTGTKVIPPARSAPGAPTVLTVHR